MTKQVLILFGGQSTEHAVSIMSARNVYGSIDWNKFSVTLGYMTRDGQLNMVDDFNNLDDGHQLWPILGTGEFWVEDSDDNYVPDVIFPVLHGVNGEDGSVQGLAQLLNVPMVGCGMAASAICMDKLIAKRLLSEAGIKTVPYMIAKRGQDWPTYTKLSEKLGRTMFVKPPRQGSSVGISRVTAASELALALDEAFKYDDTILIEKAIKGRELEVAVMGNPPNVEVSGVGEIKPDADFYDYDAKYAADSRSQIIVPANLSSQELESVRNLAEQTYQTLGCQGLARVDFFLDGKNLYVNEINTLPGFTDISMFPKLWLDFGISYPELITKLINMALEET
jgi:D-alanine-D-alanine ligase